MMAAGDYYVDVETPGQFRQRQVDAQKQIAAERRTAAIRLYSGGWSIASIARKLGCSRPTVLADLNSVRDKPPAEPVHAPDPLRNPANQSPSVHTEATTEPTGETAADTYLRSIRRR